MRGQQHGCSYTPEYQIWINMRDRCNRPSVRAYKNYGGRGIKVCSRWMHDFRQFLEDMGPRPSVDHTLDRIKNDGDYEPSNCRWATWIEQNQNQRGNRLVEFRGETLCVAEWARRFGLDRVCIRRRLEAGWTIEDAVCTPSQRPGPMLKLSADVVRKARIRRANGETISALAREHGVSINTMRAAVLGKSWRSI